MKFSLNLHGGNNKATLNMKKILILIMAVFSVNANAFDFQSILNGLYSNTDTASTTSSNPLGALGALIGGIVSSDNLEVSDLVGTWNYVSPAVSFKSDNFLQKAGGVATAVAIEEKMEPYYNKIGFDAMYLTVAADSTFTMKFKRTTLNGSISRDGDNFVFNVKIANKFSIGKMTAYVTKTGSSIDMTFDVSKLVIIMEKVASISGNSTISTVTQLLNSYDGICAGFTLNKKE